MTTTTTERLGDLIACQTVIPDDLRELRDIYGEDLFVEATRAHYPFGTYLVSVEITR